MQNQSKREITFDTQLKTALSVLLILLACGQLKISQLSWDILQLKFRKRKLNWQSNFFYTTFEFGHFTLHIEPDGKGMCLNC